MLMTSERRPAIRTLRGWALYVLHEAAPSKSARNTVGCRIAPIRMLGMWAFDIARRDPPAGVSTDKAAAEVRDVLDSIGNTCPECP
jgi:hypothetical protein